MRMAVGQPRFCGCFSVEEHLLKLTDWIAKRFEEDNVEEFA